jgi:hypothetical protein
MNIKANTQREVFVQLTNWLIVVGFTMLGSGLGLVCAGLTNRHAEDSANQVQLDQTREARRFVERLLKSDRPDPQEHVLQKLDGVETSLKIIDERLAVEQGTLAKEAMQSDLKAVVDKAKAELKQARDLINSP